MPATAALYPTTVAATSGTPAWTTTANATGSTTGTYAGWAPTTSGAVGYIQLSGYGVQAAIGTPAAIQSVAVSVRFHVTTATARWTSVTAQLFSGGTGIGSAQTLTLSTTTTNEQTFTATGVTWAQLSDLQVRVTGTKSGTQASTLNVDRVGIAVTYTTPMSTLTDDFTTADTAKWTYGAAAAVSGGQLLLTPNTSYSGFISSNAAYDLTGSELVVELPQAANGGGGTVETYIAVYVDNANSNSALVDIIGGNLKFLYRIAGVTTGADAAPPIPYDPVAHRWLRLSESGGTITWATSPDRATWTTRATWTPTWSAAALFVALGNGYSGTVSSPGVSIFDNVNTIAVPVLLVKSARSATRASRPLLTQSTPLTVKAARAPTRASRPKLTQQQPTLTVRSARSSPRAGRPLLTQTQTITVRAARSATRAGRPLLSQQQGTLTVKSARATARASRPLLTQQHPALTVPAARSATRAGRALLAQSTPLTVAAARAQTRAGTATLTHDSPLTVAAARAETRAGRVSLAVAGQIAVRDARAQTRTGAALLTHQQTVAVNGARSATRTSAPGLTQDTALSVHGARADTRTQTVVLPQPAGTLTVRAARADTRASAPALEQLQLLTVAGARAPTRADRARLTVASTAAAPPERTLTVAADNRTTPVAADDRTTTVAPDSRIHHVAADDRTLTVPAETRILLA